MTGLVLAPPTCLAARIATPTCLPDLVLPPPTCNWPGRSPTYLSDWPGRSPAHLRDWFRTGTLMTLMPACHRRSRPTMHCCSAGLKWAEPTGWAETRGRGAERSETVGRAWAEEWSLLMATDRRVNGESNQQFIGLKMSSSVHHANVLALFVAM